MKYSSRRSRRMPNAPGPEKKESPFFSKTDRAATVQTKEEAFFQPKLTIGQPGDQYEQEADAVADAVVNQHANSPVQKKKMDQIQRYATNPELDEKGTNTERIEEDKRIQEKPERQRQATEEEEPMQMQVKEEEEPVQMQAMEEEEPV